ncbi:hypothetical protein CR513_30366, partial [Mucuna pruriens]
MNSITPQHADNGFSISSSFSNKRTGISHLIFKVLIMLFNRARAQSSVPILSMLNQNDRSTVTSYGPYTTLQQNPSLNLQFERPGGYLDGRASPKSLWAHERNVLLSLPLNRDNFYNWSKAMKRAFSSKNKIRFINGNLPQPVEIDPLMILGKDATTWLYHKSPALFLPKFRRAQFTCKIDSPKATTSECHTSFKKSIMCDKVTRPFLFSLLMNLFWDIRPTPTCTCAISWSCNINYQYLISLLNASKNDTTTSVNSTSKPTTFKSNNHDLSTQKITGHVKIHNNIYIIQQTPPPPKLFSVIRMFMLLLFVIVAKINSHDFFDLSHYIDYPPLFQSNLSKYFWTYSLCHSMHIINRLPTLILHDKSPHELLYDPPPTSIDLKGRREAPRRGRPRKQFEPGEATSPYKRRKKGSSKKVNAGKTPVSQENKTSALKDENANPSSAETPSQFVNAMYDPAFERAGVPIDPLLRLFNAT